MGRLILILLAAAAIVTSITYAVGKAFKKAKSVKYIPGALVLSLSVYYFYMSRQPSQGFEGLAQFISGIMLFAGAVGGIATAIVMDYAKSRK